MMSSPLSSLIGWVGRHAFGRGASLPAMVLVVAAAAGAVVLAVQMLVAGGAALDWWQWMLVCVIAFDLGGGVVANATAAAARQYHDPERPWAPLQFAAAHVHPFAVAWLLPEFGWLAASVLYGVVVAGVVTTLLTPPDLRLAVSLVLSAFGIAICSVTTGDGWAWLAPLLVLKLVAAHATLGSAK